MTTFGDIQTRVQSNIIDLPTAVLNQIPTLINQAQRQLQINHNFKIMEALNEPTTTVNTRVLGAVPSDWKEYRGRPWFLKNDGSIVRMIQANSREDIWKAMDEADTNYPMVILQAVESDTLGNGNFWVYPLPDGNSDYTGGEYRVKIPYWAYLANLVNTGDQNWFTNNADLYLEYRATAEGFAKNWDTAHSAEWATKAAIELKDVVKKDKLLRLSTGSNTLVPLWQGANSPKLNW